mgnify:FL=1|jgi:hypothetical protein
MQKLEITFNARVPYDDDETGRATIVMFTTGSVDEVIRQFNKFLILNDWDVQVENPSA